jgi:hypothetical protein
MPGDFFLVENFRGCPHSATVQERNIQQEETGKGYRGKSKEAYLNKQKQVV